MVIYSHVLQSDAVSAELPCCSWGSNYPKTVEILSPKLSAYKTLSGLWFLAL